MGSTHNPIQWWVLGDPLACVKWMGHGVDHSHPSAYWVKNAFVLCAETSASMWLYDDCIISLQNCKLHMRVIVCVRTECLKLLVAVTVLTCATEADRAEILNKWIEVAIETKTALGNLYGFCGVMMGLCMPQVSTWLFFLSTGPVFTSGWIHTDIDN